MRETEIKFRGKDRNGNWVYGYFIKSQTGKCFILSISGFIIEVDCKTIGQFIGLHDKNKKEIYKGDIVKIYPPHGVYEEEIGIIEYSERRASFMVKIGNVLNPICNVIPTSLGLVDPPINLEVIGNVYDNPELLEKIE